MLVGGLKLMFPTPVGEGNEHPQMDQSLDDNQLFRGL